MTDREIHLVPYQSVDDVLFVETYDMGTRETVTLGSLFLRENGSVRVTVSALATKDGDPVEFVSLPSAVAYLRTLTH